MPDSIAAAREEAGDDPGRIVVNATLATITLVLPVFLYGALIVLVRDDISVTDGQLGLTISAYFVVSTLTSVPGGRLADRIGPRAGMTIGTVSSCLALVGIGALAGHWTHLAGFLALAGLGTGIGMPSSNLAVARLGRSSPQGLAFGIKQASAPAAGVLSGFAVPLLGLTIGWQPTVILVPLVLLAAFLFSRPATEGREASEAERNGASAPLLPLVLLGAMAALASAGATAMIGFFVESAVERGFAAGTAGYALGIGSVFGIFARVLWGWLADRRERGHLSFLAVLFAIGSVGFGLLGFVESATLLVVAAVVIFITGWSWSGLLFLVTTLGSPGSPATASGIASAGAGLGGLLGPIVFGLIVQASSYTTAWVVTGSWMIGAALLAQITRVTWIRMLASRPTA